MVHQISSSLQSHDFTALRSAKASHSIHARKTPVKKPLIVYKLPTCADTYISTTARYYLYPFTTVILSTLLTIDPRGWSDVPDDNGVYSALHTQEALTAWDRAHQAMLTEDYTREVAAAQADEQATLDNIQHREDTEGARDNLLVACIQVIPRATVPYDFNGKSRALQQEKLMTFVGFSAKRGGLLCAISSGASPENVNLDDGSVKGLQLIALPSHKPEHWAALIPSDKIGGNAIMQIKRWIYAPVNMKPEPNPRFADITVYLKHLKDSVAANKVPEPYITGDLGVRLDLTSIKLAGARETQYLTWKRLYFPANFSVPAVVKHALARFFKEGQPHEGPLDWNLIIEAAINIRFIQSHNLLDDQQNRAARRFRREPFVDLLKGLGANAVDSHSVPHVTPAQALVYYMHWPAWHEDCGALGYMHPFRFAFCRYEDDLKRAGFDFKMNDEKLNWALASKWVDSLENKPLTGFL
ncbi:hypothetical protein PG987_016667 [Apiospora arundinis]